VIRAGYGVHMGAIRLELCCSARGMNIVCEVCSASYNAEVAPGQTATECPFCGHVEMLDQPRRSAEALPPLLELDSYPELDMPSLPPTPTSHAGGGHRWKDDDDEEAPVLVERPARPTPTRGPTTAARMKPRLRDRARALVLVGAGVLGLGVFGVALKNRDAIVSALSGFSDTGDSVSGGANPLAEDRVTWLRTYRDLEKSAEAYLEMGEAEQMKETEGGHAAANDAYRKAIVRDARSATAIAAYVENLALWRYSRLPLPERRKLRRVAAFAAELEPNNPRTHRALGALGLAEGDTNGCREGADKAIELKPDDALALLILAECFIDGNARLALQKIEALVTKRPEVRRGAFVLASTYAAVGRYASAFKVLDERLTLEPDNSALHLLYGDLARDIDDRKTALEHYVRAMKLEGDKAHAVLAQAEVLVASGEHARAEALLGALKDMEPLYGDRVTRASQLRAELALADGKPREALVSVESALSNDSKDVRSLLVGIEAAMAVDSDDIAAGYARRALALAPSEPAVLVLEARRLEKSNPGNKQTVSLLSQASEIHPEDPRLHALLAAEFFQRGRVDQAYAFMRQVAEEDPKAMIERAVPDVVPFGKESLRFGQARFSPKGSAEAKSVANAGVAVLAYHAGDRKKARSSIEASLLKDPGNLVALLYGAQLAIDAGKTREAAKFINRARRSQRGSAVASLLSARIHLLEGKAAKAETECALALRQRPGFWSAKVEQAAASLAAGNRNAAVAEAESLVGAIPTNFALRRLLYRLGT
jgi:predicted Zn-dependent protease